LVIFIGISLRKSNQYIRGTRARPVANITQSPKNQRMTGKERLTQRVPIEYLDSDESKDRFTPIVVSTRDDKRHGEGTS
jgi:hypothetical protein